jgi:acyl-homoserine-lactone acylase
MCERPVLEGTFGPRRRQRCLSGARDLGPMVTSFGDGCPDDRSIMTHSQSTDPSSPWYADQTKLFSRKRWVNPPFCRGEMRRAHPVSVTELGQNGVR